VTALPPIPLQYSTVIDPRGRTVAAPSVDETVGASFTRAIASVTSVLNRAVACWTAFSSTDD